MEDCEVLQRRGGWWEDILVNRCTFPIAPINTFSNLAYILAGVTAFSLKPTWASAVFGLALIFLGIGSALYHGTKRGWASKLDNAGMYAVFTSLVTYSISPTHPLIGPIMVLVATIVAWRLAYATKSKVLLNPIVGMFVAISTISVALNGVWQNALLSFTLFGLAYIIWWRDRKRTFWMPRYGHAIWHLLTAIGILILFLGVV